MLALVVKLLRQRLRAGARRELILERALVRFGRAGFLGAGTRDLARAAGVTEPVLYRHFASKEVLFAAVLQLVTRRLVLALQQALAGAVGVRERVEALAGALPRLLQQRQDELRVLCGAAAAHADARQKRLARQALQAIGRALARGLRGGRLRRGVSAEVAACFLLQIGLGSALLRPVQVAAVMRPGYTRRLVALIERALLP